MLERKKEKEKKPERASERAMEMKNASDKLRFRPKLVSLLLRAKRRRGGQTIYQAKSRKPKNNKPKQNQNKKEEKKRKIK